MIRGRASHLPDTTVTRAHQSRFNGRMSLPPPQTAQPRPPSSPAAVFIAVMVGGAAATAVSAVLTFILSYVLGGSLTIGGEVSVSLTVYRLVFAVLTIVSGAVVGGAVLPLRPQGPLAPILAAPSALVADRIGGLLGFLAYAIVSDETIPIDRVDLEFCIRFLTHVEDFWGVLYIILPLAAAGGLAFMRVMSAAKPAMARGAAFAYGAPQAPGIPAPGMPGAGPYGQPQYPGQPQQYPGQPPAPGHAAPGQPTPGQPGPGQPPYGGQPGFPPAGPQGPPPPPGGPWPPQDRPGG